MLCDSLDKTKADKDGLVMNLTADLQSVRQMSQSIVLAMDRLIRTWTF